MDKYYLDVINTSTSGITYYDACSKPHSDAQNIALRMGYKPIIFHSCKLRKLGEPIWKKIILHTYNEYQKLVLSIESRYKLRKIRNAIIFIQGGYTASNLLGTIRMLRKHKNKVILLVHDLETIRESRFWKQERNFIQNSDVIIAHTEPMARFIKEELGFNGRIVLLEFFDYLNNCKQNYNRDFIGINIVYAGNLKKAEFISKLCNINPHDNFHFFLYGIPNNTITTNKTVIYKGKFMADNISQIEGNWGLVWDGPNINSCTGNFGEYLKYNAPFKFSLAIATGMPVIVWKKSALAYYVEKYNIGITVDSLNNIYEKIQSISKNQLISIHNNVIYFSERVRSGKMLETAIIKAQYYINI